MYSYSHSHSASYGSNQEQSRNPFGPVDEEFPPALQNTPIRRSPWNNSDLFPGGGNWPAPTSSRSYSSAAQPSSYGYPSSYATSPVAGYGSTVQPNQQPAYGQNTGYAGYGAQSPQYNTQPGINPTPTGYVNQNLSQFDPYSNNAGSQWGQQNSMQSPGGYGSSQPQATGYGQQQQSQTSYQSPHPRDYIRANKQSLEAWDQYSWKQAMNSFESLQKAWQTRYQQLSSQYGGYVDPNVDSMIRTAQHNVDSVAAAYYQLKEAFQGYKMSTDPSSRKRVKEALNAGLTGLPDWPN